MNFANYLNWSDIIVPPSVEAKMRQLNLRVKDILWTLNQPFKEKQYPEGKYKRMRWFGSYWMGLYCKFSPCEQKWVILTCWRDDVMSIA